MTDLPKTFDPAAIEARWAERWEADGLFRPERPDAEPFTIVNPPPNVTGALHIGHALDNTLQDVIVRYERMRGRDVRWVVGTDHAGIATQMVVERQLADEGLSRAEMGRDAFLERVWAWKAESGDTMGRQLRRLGCSMDWANERFTMDEGMSCAVVEVFVRLHEAGLIYRDKRLVNWDPALGTAISDLEVETREVAGHFWHLRYPLADGSGAVSVATTRPETLLADMAVAVHPDDERYHDLIGRMVALPITGRQVPIVADAHADPALGSGAVKITPGHDFNDFEVGVRAGIEPRAMLNMLDAEARVVQTADGLVPDELLGLNRDAARARVVELLEAAGALERVEDRTVQQPVGDRSGAVIEPWLTDQWYVDAETLAGPAMEAVRSGAVEIVPKSWEKTFFHWMETIQPWCVSRQLWWGHRVPAWFGPVPTIDNALVFADSKHRILPSEPQIFVARSEEEAIHAATGHYPDVGETKRFKYVKAYGSKGEAIEASIDDRDLLPIYRDPDVLDTWFSSALWPFATLGWPGESVSPPFQGGDQGVGGDGEAEPGTTGDGSPSARTHPLPGREGSWNSPRTPNDLLISGFDILFFWDARMMMMGERLTGRPPFKRLYLHGLVRAADGRKMSKSKGNAVDPIGLIDRYGADALRFFMTAMESQGRDVKMDEARLTGYRNFATKIWNAARFLQANGVGASTEPLPPPAEKAVNRWILAEAAEAVRAMELALADLRFDAAADAVYHFAWDRFCDWYLELIKGEVDAETKAVAGWTFDTILRMLHPIMPFVTEELWALTGDRAAPLIVSDWPRVDARSMDAEAAREINWLIRLVQEIRSSRAAMNVPGGAWVGMSIYGANQETKLRIANNTGALQKLARVHQFALIDNPVPVSGSVQLVVDGTTYSLSLKGVIDLDAERARLTKAVEAAGKERDSLAKRLDNPSFVERAKPDAVAKARTDHAERAAETEGLAAALARLG